MMKKLREAHVLLEIFLVSNFAFLSVDIYLAHSINRFRHWAEWVPFWFSLAATVALVPNLVRSLVPASEWRPSRTGAVVGATAITVGILGMFWHLDSHFFAEQTLHNLVYAAPFIAPHSASASAGPTPARRYALASSAPPSLIRPRTAPTTPGLRP